MRLDDDRQILADALSGVAGVRGYPYRPPVPADGDAWPTLDRLDLHDGLAWRPSWVVNVVLPTDERSAQSWVEENFLAIVGALRAVPGAWPDAGDLVPVDTPEGRYLVLEITLRSSA